MIYVVGLGPGGKEEMTERAFQALERCQIIIGYDSYIDLIKEHFPLKKILSTPMKTEVDRCRQAFALAQEGYDVALVSSGDAGVYGMAGVLLEVCNEADIKVEIVPGVTAACSAAAVLGAPLMHDFAVISLSDLLTPWPVIERRLRAAGEADFVVVLYNPSSRKRADYLQRAGNILLSYRPASTPAGWVRQVGRKGEEYRVLTLGEMIQEKVDMFTTVIIGNLSSRIIKGRIVTPRGYRELP